MESEEYVGFSVNKFRNTFKANILYPLYALQIETHNYCNGQCIFCPHKSLITTHGTMDNSLFLKILEDAKEIPTISRILPMLNGEPFAEWNFIGRLRAINSILPDKQIVVFTNGSYFSHNLIDELVKINNLVLYVSINATTRKKRFERMGLDDYDKVIEMTNYYDSVSNSPSYKSIVHLPDIKDREIKKFKKIWGEKGIIIYYKNFAGGQFNAKPATNCKRAISEMTILYDGRVNLCCMDMKGEMIFGDVNKSSVKEIWYSPERQKYAILHSKELSCNGPCSNCTGA